MCYPGTSGVDEHKNVQRSGRHRYHAVPVLEYVSSVEGISYSTKKRQQGDISCQAWDMR